MRNDKPASAQASEWLNKIGIDGGSPLPFDDEDARLWSDLNEDVAETLRLRYAQFRQTTVFKPGDLVTWKPGMNNKTLPKPGQPAVVVVQVLDQPVMDREPEGGSCYFREPLNLVLGVVLSEGKHRGNFVLWHFDGRRFMHWKSN